MEYSNINTQTNQVWEEQRKIQQEKLSFDPISRKTKLAEIAFIRELFHDRLPTGDNLSDVDAYLDNLESIIEQDGKLNDEQFEPERELIDPETGCRVPYRYHSSSLTHKRAITDGEFNGLSTEGGTDLFSDSQGLDHPTPSRRSDLLQDQSTVIEHPPYLEVSENESACNYQRPSDDDSDDDLYPAGKLECSGNS